MRLRTSLIVLSLLVCTAEPLLAERTPVSIDLRIGTYEGGHLRGEMTARRHLQEGKLRLIAAEGLTVPRSEEFESALLSIYAKHGIEITSAGSCTSAEDERGYINGYNSVTKVELDKRFGPNFLARTEKQADALSRRKPR